MTWPRATAALLGFWISIGAAVEAYGWHERTLAKQARAHAVVEANAAKATRFVEGCVRGVIVALDDIAFDCSLVRQLQTPARLLRDELAALLIAEIERLDRDALKTHND